ncbi:MAG TPA: 50S ribosomal protein L15 [Candidatus Mcinerneyibacteriales bacterium]|nr:50S ribosomal protein L15 [Candidatus Mcinerneyibacteriales bacterium]HPE20794.1 50S ribosomal protein L15 [Candidatus Mcinerneyibacteriales bacterium]
MKLDDLRPAEGSRRNSRRVGRGNGSGWGCTAGRGNNGQKARAGYSRRFGFEGGQMPLYRRVPKRGFKNPFRVEYDIVNVGDLSRVEAEVITVEEMKKNGLVRINAGLVKILGEGDLEKPVTVEAHRFSQTAREKIEKAGGKAQVIS